MMNKFDIKKTIQRQASSFDDDFQRKLHTLITGEGFGEQVSAEPADALMDAFAQVIEPSDNSDSYSRSDQANEERQAVQAKIAALRGCSLPGDYLVK